MADQLAILVERWSGGDQAALKQVIDLLYDELRALAHTHMQREREDHTLSTTALVHEVYVQMAGRTGPDWQGRARFFALVSKVMRHVLVDHARKRQTAKRGGQDLRIDLPDDVPAGGDSFEVLAVNDALDRLAAHDERLAQLVECRFFGGMSDMQIADVLDVSTRTVGRDWLRARAYLFTMLGDGHRADGGRE
jgi:RNA polymerase sigma factor (TIGR02999 family)